jgi:predicted PurR-regulated permease PerM
MIAAAILGIPGAILAVPFAAVVKIVLREAGEPRRARMSALRVPGSPAAREDGSPQPVAGSTQGTSPG